MKDILISNLLFKHHKQIQSRRKSIRPFLRSLIVNVNSHITGLEFHITAKHKTFHLCQIQAFWFCFVFSFTFLFCFLCLADENVHKTQEGNPSYVILIKTIFKEPHGPLHLWLLLFLSLYMFLILLPSPFHSQSFINFINREIPLALSLALPLRVNNFA